MPGTITWTKSLYQAVVYYLSTGVKPPGISESKFSRIKSKIKRPDGRLFAYKGTLYITDGGKEARLVLQEEDPIRQKIMENFYLDPSTTAQDPAQFLRRLSERYEGFSRREVEHFLKSQRCWQMSKRKKQKNEKAITPLYTDHANQHWQCDFIVFSDTLKWYNLGLTYIFTVIDHWSKCAWAFATRTRDQTLVVENLNQLFLKHGAPEALHADNEFNSGGLQKLLEKWSVKLVHSEPYKPQSHGGIERFNRTLKTELYRTMTLYDSKQWADVLPLVVKNYNTRKHSAHGFKPLDLYRTLDESMMSLANKRLGKYREKRILKIPHVKETVFDGSHVRIAQSSFPENRKNAFLQKKGILPQWSEATYSVIDHVYPNRGHNPNHLFILNGKNKLFTEDELQRIPQDQDETIPVRPVFNPQFQARTNRVQTQKRTFDQVFIDQPVETRAQKRTRLAAVPKSVKMVLRPRNKLKVKK